MISSRGEVYLLVAISYSRALPRRMLISAAWSARWLRVLKALELAIFGGYPQKTPTPDDQRPTFRDSCPAPVTILVAVLRPVAFYFRRNGNGLPIPLCQSPITTHESTSFVDAAMRSVVKCLTHETQEMILINWQTIPVARHRSPIRRRKAAPADRSVP